MSLMSLLQGNFDTHRVLPRAQAMNKANAFLKITCWSKSEQFDKRLPILQLIVILFSKGDSPGNLECVSLKG
jgi:hypothetical protein